VKILAAIPCFNTEPFIAGVVSRARKYVDLVVVIDDGSYDGTAEVARAAGALVVRHEKNLGKGAAMKTLAQNTEADIIVFPDGDGQHHPEDIPKIIAPILQNKSDLVIGSRTLVGAKVSGYPLTRRLSNSLASLVISLTISFLLPLTTLFKCPVRYIKITDCTSGFRAIKREAWQKLDLVSQRF
jgi:glycosyltransferase involved in cell wall biosynthesis